MGGAVHRELALVKQQMKRPIDVIQFDVRFHCDPPAVGAKIRRLSRCEYSRRVFLLLDELEFCR